MNDEILDEAEKEEIDNRPFINRIVQISIGTVFLFYLIEQISVYLPENLIDKDGVQIRTIGLIVTTVIIINGIVIPRNLNKIKPKWSIAKVICGTGLIIFLIEIVFKLIQHFSVRSDGSIFEYLFMAKAAAILAVIGMLIANISIHNMRGKKTLIPVLLMIIIWIAIGMIVTK